VLLWNVFNFVTLLGALGALLERQQRRTSPRMPVTEAANIAWPGQAPLRCTIEDLSAQGARVRIDTPVALEPGQPVALCAYAHALQRPIELPARVRTRSSDDGLVIGVAFDNLEPARIDEAVAFAYGDSARWLYFQERRARPITFFQGLTIMLSLVWRPFFLHLKAMAARWRPEVAAEQSGRSA